MQRVSAHTVTSISMHRSRFNLRTVHMGILVEQVAVGHVFLQYSVVPSPYYFTNAACSFIHVS